MRHDLGDNPYIASSRRRHQPSDDERCRSVSAWVVVLICMMGVLVIAGAIRVALYLVGVGL